MSTAATGWRKTDTLPEIGQHVLVACRNRSVHRAHLGMNQHRKTVQWFGDNAYRIRGDQVVAWFPVPKLPQWATGEMA